MKTVTVLMSTYNGEKYLPAQIESLLKQTGVSMSILVRDDGSTDSTKELLNEYQSRGILTWYNGDNMRPAKSFLNLIKEAPQSAYYAFCDQDDVWNFDKLSIAINKLEALDSNSIPCLYCSNYQLVDAELNLLPDNGHVSTTSFGAALIASNCTGCTTVFNHALLEVLRFGDPKVIVMHDDWAHKVCLAVGGRVIYDDTKTLKYRQHGNNADGGVHSNFSKMRQITRRITSKERMRSRQIEELCRIYGEYMSQDFREMAGCISEINSKNLISRIKVIMDGRIKSPFQRSNRGFYVAVLLKYF